VLFATKLLIYYLNILPEPEYFPKGVFKMRNLNTKFVVVAASFFICFCFQLTIKSQDRKAAAEKAVAEAETLKAQRTGEEMRSAIIKYEEALAIWRELGNKTEEASLLKEIGVIYYELSETERSLEYFDQAITLARAAGNKEIEGDAIIGLGNSQGLLGNQRRALESYSQTLKLAREIKHQKLETTALVSLSYAHDQLGEKQIALDYLNQALPIVRQSADKQLESMILVSYGVIHHSLGDPKRAIDYFLQSLAIVRQTGDQRQEASTLGNIGAAYYELGEHQKAIDFYNQSLEIERKFGNRVGEVIALSNLAVAYKTLGNKPKALETYNQALTIQRELKARSSEAVLLTNIGQLYFSMKDYQKAFEHFSLSLPILRETGEMLTESIVLSNLARTERARGNLSEARMLIENSIQIVESVRAAIASQELRASYLANTQRFYKFHIDVLMSLHAKQPDKGFDALALQTSERARARGLLDILSEAKLDIRQGVDKSLIERELALQKQLNAKDEERRASKNAAISADLDKEIQKLSAAYQDLQAEIKRANPRLATLTQPKPAELKEIQRTLDADTLLLEYSLGNESSYLWIVSQHSIKSFTLPKRQDIEAKAREFYESVKKADAEQAAQKSAAELSKILIEPAVTELGSKRLLIVGDGVLQYIPFAALPVTDSTNNKQPLIVNHEIVYMPSASTLAVMRDETKNRLPAAKTIAVLADPVFDANDTRVNNIAKTETKLRVSNASLEKATRDAGFQNTLPRLPFTRREGTTILSLVPESERKRAMDFEASRAAVVSPELSQYRIIHFATHGLLNSQHPELSGIVLSLVDEKGKSQDGFLRLNEIYNLKLPADLIVLSACQTALGKEIKGEGLVGLTRGFMYAGAQRVVASLWSVDDQATSELMKTFYQGIFGERKLRPAAALREAQITMLKTKRFASPYYWSAFTLQGEWR
jgi:CHAT domain-containing protein